MGRGPAVPEPASRWVLAAPQRATPWSPLSPASRGSPRRDRPTSRWRRYWSDSACREAGVVWARAGAGQWLEVPPY